MTSGLGALAQPYFFAAKPRKQIFCFVQPSRIFLVPAGTPTRTKFSGGECLNLSLARHTTRQNRPPAPWRARTSISGSSRHRRRRRIDQGRPSKRRARTRGRVALDGPIPASAVSHSLSTTLSHQPFSLPLSISTVHSSHGYPSRNLRTCSHSFHAHLTQTTWTATFESSPVPPALAAARRVGRPLLASLQQSPTHTFRRQAPP